MDEVDCIEVDQFRLEKIQDKITELELNIEKRKKLNKNYKKASQILHGCEIGMYITSVTVASIGAATVIGNVISIPISAICTVLGLTGKIVVPKLMKKQKKHLEILNNKKTCLNNINNLLSRALDNGSISKSEFELMITS